MYQGAVTQAAMAYAIGMGEPWVIVSAAHGVLQPDEVVEPYERGLSDLTPSERVEWAMRVRAAIGPGPHTSLLPTKYDKQLRAADMELYSPLDGLRDRRTGGMKRRWLNANRQAERLGDL